MTEREAALAVVDALEALAIPYMLVGSFSSSFYGIPRSSKDADFVIALGSRSVHELANRLAPAFRLDPQMSFETVTMTSRHLMEVVGTPFKIELFHLSDDAHDQERFRRRRRVAYLDRQIQLPTAEDVIVTKLRWTIEGRRTKDWDDTRDVIAVQGDRIDWDYVHRWADLHGTRKTLDEIRGSLPSRLNKPDRGPA
jgi:hypothetical protein